METNAIPKLDTRENPTHCCPKFNPDGWDERTLHFKDKLFLKARTRDLFHIPINMGSVFEKTFADIQKAHADSPDSFIVLSRDPSPWSGEHYFSVMTDVPGHEMVTLTGDYLTRVFEGPYKNAPKWEKQMEEYAEAQGKQAKKTYFYYTTCPKCAKYYGKNYVVGVTEV